MYRLVLISFCLSLVAPSAFSQDVPPSQAIENSDQILRSAEDVLGEVDKAPSSAAISSPAAETKPETIMDIGIDATESSAAKQPDISSSIDLRLEFEPEIETLSDAQTNVLLRDVVPQLKDKQGQVVEVFSFATHNTPGESAVRRISLMRAIVVQDFLIAQGIDERQIYLRPLGRVESKGDAIEVSIRRR